MLHCVGIAFFFADLTCTPVGQAPRAAAYCDVARPIYWAAADTRATKEQADRENAKWKRLCAKAAPGSR
jgi:hypothetical protein